MIFPPEELQTLINDLKEEKKWAPAGAEELDALIMSLQRLRHDSEIYYSQRRNPTKEEQAEYDQKLKNSVDAYNRFIIRIKSEETLDSMEGISESTVLSSEKKENGTSRVIPYSEAFESKYHDATRIISGYDNNYQPVSAIDKTQPVFENIANAAFDKKKLNAANIVRTVTETEVLPRKNIDYIADMNNMTDISFSHLRASDKAKMETIVRDFKELGSLRQKMLNESANDPDELAAARKSIARLNRNLSKKIKTFSEDFLTRSETSGSREQKKETVLAKKYLLKAQNSLDRAFLQEMRELNPLTKEETDEKQYVYDDPLLNASLELDTLGKEKIAPEKDPFKLEIPEDADEDFADPIEKTDSFLDFAMDDEKEIMGDEYQKQLAGYKKNQEDLKKSQEDAKKRTKEAIDYLTEEIENYKKNPLKYGFDGQRKIKNKIKARTQLQNKGLEPEFIEDMSMFNKKNKRDFEEKAPKDKMKLYDEPETERGTTLLQKYEKDLSGIKDVKKDLIDALNQGNRHVFNGTKRYNNLIVLAEQLKRNKELLEQNQDSPNRKEYVRAVLLSELNLENRMKEYIDIKQAEVDRAVEAGKKPRFNSERRLGLVKDLRKDIRALRDEDMAKHAEDLVELELDIENRRMTDPAISNTIENYLDAVVRRSVFENLHDRYGAQTTVPGTKQDEKRRKTLEGLVSNSKLAKEMQTYEDVIKNTAFGKELFKNIRVGFLSHTATSLKHDPDKLSGDKKESHSDEDRVLEALRKEIKKSELTLLDKMNQLSQNSENLGNASERLRKLELTRDERTAKAAMLDERKQWPANKKKIIMDNMGNPITDIMGNPTVEYDVLDFMEKNSLKEATGEKEKLSKQIKTLEEDIKKLSKAHDDLLKVAENLGYCDSLRKEGMQIDDSKTLANGMKKAMQKYEVNSRDNKFRIDKKGNIINENDKNLNISIMNDSMENSANGTLGDDSSGNFIKSGTKKRNGKIGNSIESGNSNIISNDDNNINNDIKPIGFRKKISKGGKKF